MYYLATLPSWLLCILFVVSGVGFTIAGLLFVRKYAPPVDIHGEQIRPTATVCAIIGSLVALLLAFVVVNVWQRYNEQDRLVSREASELANLYRGCRGLNKEQQMHIQDLIRKYTVSLVKDAWPSLENGEENEKAWVSYNNLYLAIIHLKPAGESANIVFSRMIDQLNNLADFRRTRILNSRLPIIPGVLWVILIVSCYTSIAFTFFFTMGTRATQIVISSIHAGILSMILYLVVLLNYPYRSAIKIKPYPIENLLKEAYPFADLE